MEELMRLPDLSHQDLARLSQAEQESYLSLLEKKVQVKEGIPFLYGWPYYSWAREFMETTNKVALLCAANQISKSSTQIRKCLDWATNKAKWPSLWRRAPTQFWYLYPNQDTLNAEWETKWSQFIPQKGMENDPTYGFKVEKDKKDLVAIHFNSGVHLYFKQYSQKTTNLQTGTCDAIFCDEELPLHHYDELMFRLSASDGYFHMVFTATLGQEFWRQAMEPVGTEKPLLPNAWKRQITMYDCLRYEDGTPSHWTMEKIQRAIDKCQTKNEVLRRVFGRFVKDSNQKYPTFDPGRHMVERQFIAEDWFTFAGVDVGSGGTAHPSAIVFVAVRPDYRFGVVYQTWRGDGEITTSGDVFQKFLEMRKDIKGIPTGFFYDYSAKDFGTIATRGGESFRKAEKSHVIGEQILNTLFKSNMLVIIMDEQSSKLSTELNSLGNVVDKTKQKDDLADALRYCVSSIPWDWTGIVPDILALESKPPEQPLTPHQQQIHDRRHRGFDREPILGSVESEMEEYNGFLE